MKKKILLIGTGGTITAKKIDGSWLPGSLSEKELFEFIPEAKEIADVEVLDLYRIDSSDFQPQYWQELARVIYAKQDEFDGIVVSHGTDTMHYTATAISFMVQNPHCPIVFTGAQVPPQNLGSDAKRNVIDALRVTNETDMRESVIVFNGKILRANRAKKFREAEYEAFESVGMPPLGVVEHDIRLTGEHFGRHNKKARLFDGIEPRVCIQKITPGFDPRIISQIIELGYRGIVLEGYGAGNVPIMENSLLQPIKDAVKSGIPVVVSTQCAIGCSWMTLYENGRKALEAGAIPGHDMTSETAMVKLMWVLGNYPREMATIKNLMLTDIAGEISDIRAPKEKRIWEYSL